jgi:hypothetical protein
MSDNPIVPPADEETPEPIVVKSEVGEAPPPDVPEDTQTGEEEAMKPRLERLGGEPAPDITPEEFARLQQSGQIHIDPRGRVRSTRTTDTDAGVTLRKRRAWYAR